MSGAVCLYHCQNIYRKTGEGKAFAFTNLAFVKSYSTLCG